MDSTTTEKMMTTLLEQITTVFAEVDAKSLAALPEEVKESRKWYREQYAKLREEFPLEGHLDNHGKFWGAMYRISTKQEIEDNSWSLDDHVERVMKRTKRTQESRNKRIAQKFEKAGIANIESNDLVVVYGEDFCGEWIIEGHLVKLDVIWAGGYNIQCLHCRVLCKIKKLKEAA